MRPVERAEYLSYAMSRRYQGRLDYSRRIVEEFLEKARNPYVAYSTGKDSTCMAALIWEQAPDTPGVYFDAQCAFPESTELLDRMQAAGRKIIRYPCEPFLETLQRAGGPTSPKCERETMLSTVYRPIRALLKEHSFDGVALGLRADESVYRRMMARKYGPLFWQKRDQLWECNPVIWWSWQDVWAYILSSALDYNRAYDRMGEMPERARRISYWAGETGRTHGRWAWLRQNYPQLWNQFVALFPEVSQYT